MKKMLVIASILFTGQSMLASLPEQTASFPAEAPSAQSVAKEAQGALAKLPTNEQLATMVVPLAQAKDDYMQSFLSINQAIMLLGEILRNEANIVNTLHTAKGEPTPDDLQNEAVKELDRGISALNKVRDEIKPKSKIQKWFRRR